LLPWHSSCPWRRRRRPSGGADEPCKRTGLHQHGIQLYNDGVISRDELDSVYGWQRKLDNERAASQRAWQREQENKRAAAAAAATAARRKRERDAAEAERKRKVALAAANKRARNQASPIIDDIVDFPGTGWNSKLVTDARDRRDFDALDDYEDEVDLVEDYLAAIRAERSRAQRFDAMRAKMPSGGDPDQRLPGSRFTNKDLDDKIEWIKDWFLNSRYNRSYRRQQIKNSLNTFKNTRTKITQQETEILQNQPRANGPSLPKKPMARPGRLNSSWPPGTGETLTLSTTTRKKSSWPQSS
jgi:hypothetical protein